ncbi:MAG: transcription antitermination factor NusB [Alphaproteobacteria bacterium]
MINPKQPLINARLMAVQAYYAKVQSGESWDQVISRFLMEEIGGTVLQGEKEEPIQLEAADKSLFAHLVQYVRDNEADLDKMVNSAFSDKIKKERLDLTFKGILTMGTAEFFVNPELDTAIIVNEYVDMTRSFYDGAEVKIANAVLDKLAKVIRG